LFICERRRITWFAKKNLKFRKILKRHRPKSLKRRHPKSLKNPRQNREKVSIYLGRELDAKIAY